MGFALVGLHIEGVYAHRGGVYSMQEQAGSGRDSLQGQQGPRCRAIMNIWLLQYETSDFVLCQNCFCFDYLVSLEILYIFQDEFFCFCKNHHWDFNKDFIILQITLDSIDILTKLNLPVHERELSFIGLCHFFQQCFIVFSVQVFCLLD